MKVSTKFHNVRFLRTIEYDDLCGIIVKKIGMVFRSPWAVKKVNKRHALSQFGQRLEDEAKILKSLSHPNIIGFRGFNKKQDGTHALVMEDGHKALLDIIEVLIIFYVNLCKLL